MSLSVLRPPVILLALSMVVAVAPSAFGDLVVDNGAPVQVYREVPMQQAAARGMVDLTS